MTTWSSLEARMALVNDPEAAPELRLAAAEFLAGEGLFADMAPLAATLAELPATAVGGRRLVQVCRQFDRWCLQDRLEPYADPQAQPERAALTRSGLLLRRNGSRDCVIVFVGDARSFWVTLYMLERVLPKDRHILFLKDPDRAGYVFGTPALGTHHHQIAPALCRFLATLGVRRFHVIGTSSGGFSALHFALTAGAAGSLALSPWTTIASFVASVLSAAPVARQGEIRARAPAQPDLAALIAGPPALSHGPLNLVYGADHDDDRAQCERLKAHPGVTLYPVANCAQHDTLGPLIASGAIVGQLGRLFDAD
jgi:hypothetical protein